MSIANSVKFLTDEGIVLYNNRRVTIFDAEVYQSLWQDLIQNFGASRAHEIFVRYGYAAGCHDAIRGRDAKFSDDKWFVRGIEIIGIRGIAKIKINQLNIDEEQGIFYAELEAKNSFEAEQHRLRFDTHSSCSFLSGYLSGYVSMFMNQEIYFNEISCKAHSDPQCIMIGKPLSEWPRNQRVSLNPKSAENDENKYKQILNELKASVEKYRDLYDNAPVVYFSINDKSEIVECNRTGYEILGYDREEIIGKKLKDLFIDFDEEQFWDACNISAGFKNMEGICSRYDKSNIYVSLDAVVSYDEFGLLEHVRCTLIDISARKRLELMLKDKNEMLEKMNKTDALTAVYNRRYLMEMFESEFEKSDRYGYPLSMIILDLDRFKQVNDYFGHQVGDMVLKKVAGLLCDNVRRGDIVARFGGEEFVVLAPCTDLNGAYDIADKLRAVIEKKGRMEIEKDVTVHITASFGLATYFNNNYVGLDSFVQAADDALLKSKRQGRNRVTLTETKI